jgi:hypothetical protein
MAIIIIYLAQVHEDGDTEITRSAMSSQAAQMNGFSVFNDLRSITDELEEYGIEPKDTKEAVRKMLKVELNEWVKV